jgi:hypothetical protein
MRVERERLDGGGVGLGGIRQSSYNLPPKGILILWVISWLFTLALADLEWWQVILAFFVWPYYSEPVIG